MTNKFLRFLLITLLIGGSFSTVSQEISTVTPQVSELSLDRLKSINHYTKNNYQP